MLVSSSEYWFCSALHHISIAVSFEEFAFPPPLPFYLRIGLFVELLFNIFIFLALNGGSISHVQFLLFGTHLFRQSSQPPLPAFFSSALFTLFSPFAFHFV